MGTPTNDTPVKESVFDIFLARVDAYCSKYEITRRQLATFALDGSSSAYVFFDRLENGATTARQCRRIEAFMLKYPDGVPRND